jgi:hypothetical protein
MRRQTVVNVFFEDHFGFGFLNQETDRDDPNGKFIFKSSLPRFWVVN